MQVVHDYAREAQSKAAMWQKRAYDPQCPTPKKGLPPKNQSHWHGPGVVLGRFSEVVYRVRMPGRGRLVVLHQDRLAHYRPNPPVEAGGEASGGVMQGGAELPQAPPQHLANLLVSVGHHGTSMTMCWVMGLSGTTEPSAASSANMLITMLLLLIENQV